MHICHYQSYQLKLNYKKGNISIKNDDHHFAFDEGLFAFIETKFKNKTRTH